MASPGVEEQEPIRPLHGCFVEICNVSGTAEARDQFGRLLGWVVAEPNGRCGWAFWEAEQAAYAVTTLDGVLLLIAEESLRERAPPSAEVGGCDAVWPAEPAILKQVAGAFGALAARALLSKGYVLLQMPRDEELRSGHMASADARSAYTLPKAEFEESYLGSDHGSKILWVDTTPCPEQLGGAALLQSLQQITNLSCMLSDQLGFPLCRQCAGAMLRKPQDASADSRALLSPGRLDSSDIEEGLVELHLDFVQRRTLCLMYFFGEGNGLVELCPRQAAAEKLADGGTVKVQTACHGLLAFRHDLFTFSYRPGRSDDLVLQAWLLQEPQKIQLEAFEGDQSSLSGILGSPTLALENQVHVRMVNCQFPGEGHQLEGNWSVMLGQTDTFIKIPTARFDIDEYYETGDQFNSAGKSSSCHAGCIADNVLTNFDNEFFGIPREVASLTPCIQRILLETGYECLFLAGHTRESLRRSPMYICIADIGIEWDGFHGFFDKPDAWLGAGEGRHNGSANRFCYSLGIQGKCHQIDTACSSSLVAGNLLHAMLRDRSKGLKEGMSMGQQHILWPWPFVGLSSAGMLGSGGRCKTFDQSANGYNRGEGCGGLFCTVDTASVQALEERLACYCGSYINQDGRSASLTAPNGPSQQSVIRGSLRQAEIKPEESRAQECHGTGTALGDPIESGSVRAVYRHHQECLMVTSAKSHYGHLEAGAGSVGILKTIITLVNATVPAQVHLRHLNAHCAMEGFPGQYPVEGADIGWDYSYAGCNGFGFGGTNTHADFWAARRNEVHKLTAIPGQVVGRQLIIDKVSPAPTLPPKLDQLDYLTVACSRCLGPMCWLCSTAAPAAGMRGETRHRCSAVRTEPASYRLCSLCFKGTYQSGDPAAAAAAQPSSLTFAAEKAKVFLTGTFNAWMKPGIEMKRELGGAEVAVFEGDLAIGENLMEEFHIVVQTGDRSLILHPVVKRARQHVRVAGPSEQSEGKRWLIDGRRHGLQEEGQVFRVRLQWSDTGKSVSWTATDKILARAERYFHTYQIVSSISNWAPIVGTNDESDPSLFRWFSGRIPASGQVALLFLRDFDTTQMVYPQRSHPMDDSVPVMGPDHGGDGKRWLVTGNEGDILLAKLRVANGNISLQLHVAGTFPELNFRGHTGESYYVVGSWTGWRSAAMGSSPERSDSWRHRFKLGPTGMEDFQILVNQNWNLRLYPPSAGESPGTGLVCGPDRKGSKKNWQVRGLPGQLFVLVLDLAAEDQCDMLTCSPCADDAPVA